MKLEYHANTWFMVISSLLFAVALMAKPLLGAGWFWSLGNGLGFAALACFLYLCLDTRRGGKVRSHQLLGWCGGTLLLAHVAWFTLAEPTTWEYLKTTAPAYMWSGWLALILLLLLIISSIARLRPGSYTSHSKFRNWHKGLSALMLAASVHHLCGSGFYLREWYQWFALSGLAALCLLVPLEKQRGVGNNPIFGSLLFLAVGIALFTGLKNLPL